MVDGTADGAGPVFVSAEAAEKVFSWRDAIEALTAAYATPAPPSADPGRTVGSDAGAWLRTLPALPPGLRTFGVKIMGVATGSANPGAEYVIVLFDRETSRIAAFVDGHRVTAYRTAATSATALDRLAHPGPIRLAVLGSGLEAGMHVRAFAAVRDLDEVTVFSPTPERRDAFAAAVVRDLGVNAEAAGDPQTAVESADVVLSAARSYGEQPILFGEWLAPSTTIVSIGSTVPSQREIDVSVVEACDVIVCDAVEEVAEQTGDMLEARRAGIDFRGRTYSLHQLLAGDIDDRVRDAQRSLFKSVGSGLQDVVIADALLQRARDAGLTTPLPIQFETKR
jgi:ornithine cyclodeaminase/alanine dehydrogenase